MNITVYSSNECSYCTKQKEWLKERNIPFEEKELNTNQEYMREFIRLDGNFVTTQLTDSYVFYF